MLDYNEVKEHVFIELDGDPYEVLSSHVFRKQMRKPVNATKLKNMITGKVVERSFHQSERVNEADIEIKKIKFLYSNRGEHWFSEENDPSKRFKLDAGLIRESGDFLLGNSLVDTLDFKGTIIGVRLPITVDLKVTEAPPSIKGDTAQGGSKQVTLETGAKIATPLFVKEGDTIKINTQTKSYIERVTK